MKVVAVMEVSPTDGGGFYQALNAVMQMQRLCEGRFEFQVATADARAAPALAALGIDSFHLPTSLFDRVRPFVARSRIGGTGSTALNSGIPRRRTFGRSVRRLVNQLMRSMPGQFSLERRLHAAGADLVYFVAPWGRAHALKRLSYWMTVWDLAHVDHAEFPEMFGVFQAREALLHPALGAAALIVADSTQLGAQICHRYGVAAGRVVAVPFAPAASLSEPDCRESSVVLRDFGLEPGYLFYPAQFWAGKNHVRILEALRRCLDRGHQMQVVFAGGDMGNLQHIRAATGRLQLQAEVRFLGFVDARDMRGLYQGSRALVMPTYYGPTNLPPLEAWTLGVPVIYSSHLSDQAGDAALLVDPDDAADLADAMLACLDDALCEQLIARGHRRLQELGEQRSDAERVLLDRLQRLESRLRCGDRTAV